MVYIKRKKLGRLCRTAFSYQKEPKMDPLTEGKYNVHSKYQFLYRLS